MKAVSLLLALLCSTIMSGKEQAPPTGDKILVLDPIKIQGSPIISFAIDITVYADPETKKVNRIFVARVLPGTDAERAGLQVGDEIVKLDDMAVNEFDAVVSVETPLGKLLLNRKSGESLKLEVMARRAQKFTLRAQQEWGGPRLRR
jgi:S1-C subfamily serine protease